jgi:rhodanese-related sulfurtransferase
MMEKLPEFFSNHPELFMALAAIAGMLGWMTFQASGTRRLSPMEATGKMNRDDAAILDVRAEADFQKGHVVGAINIPLSQIDASLARLQKYKSKPVIAICATGQTSGGAVKKLRAAGFEDLYSVAGGINAWEGASLPLTRKS